MISHSETVLKLEKFHLLFDRLWDSVIDSYNHRNTEYSQHVEIYEKDTLSVYMSGRKDECELWYHQLKNIKEKINDL